MKRKDRLRRSLALGSPSLRGLLPLRAGGYGGSRAVIGVQHPLEPGLPSRTIANGESLVRDRLSSFLLKPAEPPRSRKKKGRLRRAAAVNDRKSFFDAGPHGAPPFLMVLFILWFTAIGPAEADFGRFTAAAMRMPLADRFERYRIAISG